ncbi:MAG: hydrogenase formation protein HypD [Bacteroidota bacterium]
MKFLKEYRDPEMVKRYVDRIHKVTTQPWTLMEVCGGQTHSLVKNGILELLPEQIRMVHGPGCPVCVTPLNLIDRAVHLAEEKDVILCSFGDMLRVPGSEKSLLEAKAAGADIRILYSPLEAVKIAEQHPDREVVFFAVGFETTAPANALSVVHAIRGGLKNYSILASHVLVPPAIEAVLADPENLIQGFLAAGHVCTIMGLYEYYPIVEQYQIPIVATGFEPLDLLQGILMTIEQLEAGSAKVENQYSRMVTMEGNVPAQNLIKKVFTIADREWRGIGTIPMSGYEVRPELAMFDANKKFDVQISRAKECEQCIAGAVLRGLKRPNECSQFGKGCTPTTPLGAPMVSSEGACAAYYHFAQVDEKQEELV